VLKSIYWRQPKAGTYYFRRKWIPVRLWKLLFTNRVLDKILPKWLHSIKKTHGDIGPTRELVIEIDNNR
jgi:hypothetical protein